MPKESSKERSSVATTSDFMTGTGANTTGATATAWTTVPPTELPPLQHLRPEHTSLEAAPKQKQQPPLSLLCKLFQHLSRASNSGPSKDLHPTFERTSCCPTGTDKNCIAHKDGERAGGGSTRVAPVMSACAYHIDAMESSAHHRSLGFAPDPTTVRDRSGERLVPFGTCNHYAASSQGLDIGLNHRSVHCS